MAIGTPATDQLKRAGVHFVAHQFEHDQSSALGYGLAAAAALGVDPDRVFKTLLVLLDGVPAVAIVPVSCQLSLRHVAAVLGGKRAEMCPPDQAQRVTGYVVGGISPFGQRRQLTTVVDETAELWDTILVSGGRRGLDVEVAPGILGELLGARFAAITA